MVRRRYEGETKRVRRGYEKCSIRRIEIGSHISHSFAPCKKALSKSVLLIYNNQANNRKKDYHLHFQIAKRKEAVQKGFDNDQITHFHTKRNNYSIRNHIKEVNEK